MSNTITVQDFYLLDQDTNLPTEESVVAEFKGIVTSDDNAITIQSLIVENDIKGMIAEHNIKRVKFNNKGILERTGSEVKLEPVTIKKLTWLVK